MKKTASAILAGALLAAAAAAAPTWTAIPEGRTDYQIWRGEEQLLTLETRVIGPEWSRAEFTAMAQEKGGKRVFEDKATFGAQRGQKAGAAGGLELDFAYEAAQSGPKGLSLATRSAANQDAKAVGVGLIVSTTDYFSGGEGIAAGADGQEAKFTMPLGMGKQGTAVTSIRLKAKDGGEIVIKASRPVAVTSDRGELRIWYWSEQIKAGQPEEASFTVEFPEPVAVETANRIVDMTGWMEFQSKQEFSPGSAIGAEDWMHKPAGKHGFVHVKGDKLVCDDGTEIKFWGSNIAYSRMAVEPALAKQWAEKLAKYGVNFMRMHKFIGNLGWDGLMSREDTYEIDEPRAQLFDNIHAEFKERGIYVGWSPIFAIKLHESLRPKLLAYDEIAARTEGMFGKTLYPFSTFAPDVQQVYIDLITKWLDRKNTKTGLRYADDPAVAYVELHNEADIFFPGIGKLVASCPTYKKIMQERFSEWLAKKYADDAALKAAWGGDMKKDDSLAAKNLFPFPNYNGAMPAPKRVVDSYTFLYEQQTGFYKRFVEEIRKTGYKGAIVGGCWQAADMYGHLFNIASDREVGFIDRHNYFNGIRPMITQPGSALMSAGMQQVGDRPFGFSEWAGGHVFGAECQPLIGLVGLGLQGWDLSAQFASAFSVILPDNEGQINGNFDELRATAQHPFIARFLYGNAIKEGVSVGSRRISMEELLAGNVGFEERFSLLGGANLKNFAGSVPNEALGAGRVSIDFVDKPVEPKVEMSALPKYWDRDKKIITASNGQMVWDYSGRGFLTVDAPVGAAVIGFGSGREHNLSGAAIRYENPFANVYVVAKNPGETLADAKQAVILALGRTANKGDVFEETSMTPLKRAPEVQRGADKQKSYMDNPRLLIEPVKAVVTFKRRGPCKVFALDHDGIKGPDAKEVPVAMSEAGSQVALDGAKYQAMYYLVEFGP